MVSGQTFEVDIHDLVDVYMVDDTDTISMNISGNIITSNVKISEDKDNLIELKDDGLFVQKYKTFPYVVILPLNFINILLPL